MPIAINNLSYTYAPGTAFAANALQNITLSVDDGEFVGIMGRTGCGKSTLIQLIAGLLTPSGGQILVDGQDINHRSYDRTHLRRRIGVVFQHPEHQLFETTVERDVAFGLRHFGWSSEEVRRAVKQALQAVGFDYEAVRDQSPLRFSGGEKRRIAIAGVLAAKPGILILDEPIAGLDPLGREAFLKLLETLNQAGTTILMISHNADAIANHARRVLVLEQGQVLADGPTEAVFARRDFLHDHGLGVSQVRDVAAMLAQRGFDLPPDTVRYDQLLPHLIALGKEARS